MAGRRAYIIGIGLTSLNPQPPVSPTQLALHALAAALTDARAHVQQLDALVALPPLAGPSGYLHAHRLATLCGLLPSAAQVGNLTIYVQWPFFRRPAGP